MPVLVNDPVEGRRNDPSALYAVQSAMAFRQQLKEKIASVAPATDVFGYSAGESNVVFDADYAISSDLAAVILGFSYVTGNEAGPYHLRRTPPLFHPRFNWMSAQRVAVSYLKPKAENTAVTQTNPRYTVPKYKPYTKARFTVTFGHTPADLLDDAETIRGEWERFVIADVAPGMRALGAEGAGYQLAFTEGPEAPAGATPGPAPVAGIYPRVPASRYTVLYESLITLTWLWVPHDYLFDGLRLPRLQEAVGKLNDAEFLKCPKGTLLLEAPKLQRMVWPLRSRGMSPWAWNVTLPLRFFDPPRGKEDPAGVRGHNLMPWRHNNYWYDAKRVKPDGLVGNERFYQSTDFKKIFKHWREA